MKSALRALIASVATALATSACGVPRIPGITPYKMDIQQGNLLTQEQVSRLKAGMTKEEVRIALGTPLLTDIFHGERWDYVYWHEDSSFKLEQRRLVLYFSDGKLSRVDGDVVPKEPQAKAAGQ
jgi:outer membrane protein assembly factor BamE